MLETRSQRRNIDVPEGSLKGIQDYTIRIVANSMNVLTIWLKMLQGIYTSDLGRNSQLANHLSEIEG